MKNVAIAAIIGTISVLAVAGLALAGPMASAIGTPDADEGSGGFGHMGGFGGMQHMNQNEYGGDTDGCPMYNQYNYSYDYDEDRSCPCMG